MKGHQLQGKLHNVCLLNTFASSLHWLCIYFGSRKRETWSMSDPRTLFNFGELLEDLLTWRSHSAQAGLGPVDIWAPLKKSQWNELQSTLMLHPKKTTREMPKDLHNYLRNFPAPNFFQVFSIYKEPRNHSAYRWKWWWNDHDFCCLAVILFCSNFFVPWLWECLVACSWH